MDWIIFTIIGGLLIDALIAWEFKGIADDKGFEGYFWVCFFLPVIGCIAVAALPDRKGTDEIVAAIKNCQQSQYPQYPQYPQYQNYPYQSNWNNNGQ